MGTYYDALLNGAKSCFGGRIKTIKCAAEVLTVIDMAERINQSLSDRMDGSRGRHSMDGVQPKPLPHDDGSGIYNQNRRPV